MPVRYRVVKLGVFYVLFAHAAVTATLRMAERRSVATVRRFGSRIREAGPGIRAGIPLREHLTAKTDL